MSHEDCTYVIKILHSLNSNIRERISDYTDIDAFESDYSYYLDSNYDDPNYDSGIRFRLVPRPVLYDEVIYHFDIINISNFIKETVTDKEIYLISNSNDSILIEEFIKQIRQLQRIIVEGDNYISSEMSSYHVEVINQRKRSDIDNPRIDLTTKEIENKLIALIENDASLAVNKKIRCDKLKQEISRLRDEISQLTYENPYSSELWSINEVLKKLKKWKMFRSKEKKEKDLSEKEIELEIFGNKKTERQVIIKQKIALVQQEIHTARERLKLYLETTSDEVLLKALNQAEIELQNDSFSLIKIQFAKAIKKDADKILNWIQEYDSNPLSWIYSKTSNISGDMVESGEFHVYRNALNETGQQLLKLFYDSTDKLCELGDIEKDYANSQKENIREHIKGIG